MVKLNMIYTLKTVDEFDRQFESAAKIDAQYLMIQPQADHLYLQMMEQLVVHNLRRVGTAASAEWFVEVTEEEVY